MFKRTLILMLVLLFAACDSLPDTNTGSSGDDTIYATAPQGESAKVIKIIDGDTIDVTINGQEERVRYVGMNTPERDEVCYADATAKNSAMVKGKTVTLVKDTSETDRYGRLLRYIYVDGIFVNATLVNSGFAEVVRYDPDNQYFDQFKSYEQAATNAGRGCHPTGIFDDGSYTR